MLYVPDNQLVMRWITNLKARHQLANYFCGIFTLLMSRFRFEMYCVYINTKSNMWDEPSRVFDDDDIREGPGLKEIDAYMARVFPGMLEVDVTDSSCIIFGREEPRTRTSCLVTRIRSRARWRRREKRQLSHRWLG